MTTLLINEPPLVISPSLARIVGLHEAIVIQQLHYWLQLKPVDADGRRWIYNTYEQWHAQIPFLAAESIRKVVRGLRERGIVLSRPKDAGSWNRVNEYSLDYEALQAIVAADMDGTPAAAVAPQPPIQITPKAAEKNLPTSGNPARIDPENLPEHPEIQPASIRKSSPHLYTENSQRLQKKNATGNPAADPSEKSSAKKPSVAERKLTLRAWLADIKAKGERAIPENHAVFAYAEKVKIPHEFLHLAWITFRSRYTDENSTYASKRYVDWRKVFFNAIKDNWLKLWFLNADEQYVLTTQGKQAQRQHEDAQ